MLEQVEKVTMRKLFEIIHVIWVALWLGIGDMRDERYEQKERNR